MKTVKSLLNRILHTDEQKLIDAGCIDQNGSLNLNDARVQECIYKLIKTELVAIVKSEEKKEE